MKMEELKYEKKCEHKFHDVEWYVNAFTFIPYLKKEEDFRRMQGTFDSLMVNGNLSPEEIGQLLMFMYPSFVAQAEKVSKTNKGFMFKCKKYF